MGLSQCWVLGATLSPSLPRQEVWSCLPGCKGDTSSEMSTQSAPSPRGALLPLPPPPPTCPCPPALWRGEPRAARGDRPLQFQNWTCGATSAAALTTQEPVTHRAEPLAPREFWVSNDDSHPKNKKDFFLILWFYLSLSSCSHWKSWPVIW